MKEELERWIAFHLPKRVVYWCWIRAQASQDALQASYGTKVPPNRQRAQGGSALAAD
jgi:hypothetical protein